MLKLGEWSSRAQNGFAHSNCVNGAREGLQYTMHKYNHHYPTVASVIYNASPGPPNWASILPTNTTSNLPTPPYTYQTTYYLLPPTITSPGHTSYTTHTINTDSIPPQHIPTPLSPTTYYPLIPTKPPIQHIQSCIKHLSKCNTTILHRHNVHTLCIACIILQ